MTKGFGMATLRVGALMVALFVGVVAIAQARQLPLLANVDVRDNVYAPAESTVAVGGAVRFDYAEGDEVHNVNFANRSVTCTQLAGRRTGPTGSVLPASSEGPGWTGTCTFPGPGVYRFICDDHNGMDGKVTVANPDGTLPVEATPTPTPTATPLPGAATPTPPPGGGPADTTAPPTSGATAPKLTLAATQRGIAVAGSIKGGSTSATVTVETLAALKAKAKPVRVGRASYTVAPGATKKFTLPLSAKGKSALRKLGKLKVTLRFTVAGKTETRAVTLRPAKQAKASVAQKAATVQVGDNVFSPKTATIAAGGTVTWRWVGKKGHDVVGSNFKTAVKKSGTYKRKFPKKGSFQYVCTLHRGMTGTIRVK
ncbi:plastocyanin/azurin family copper-binding protein [Solirubrobacter phytolaccae]|uniref:Plastocyanin/azurin family copper-binding protein n=1 Tax=Solirubrobacter phytolaccae TaxID=1404360 RepID=A0A9X3NCL2_9ACTN|nr:plastocyanin/azurin family copper-binding protein [Solirubrobacter phytolaccae]MDA0182400.1 plastocyanin/azurin family copper-binding protein [Solirubrobacter phytolaccae]